MNPKPFSLLNHFTVPCVNAGTSSHVSTPHGADDRAEITRTALRLLDTATYPRATFDSTRVVAAGGVGALEGDLTVRGRTRPLTLEVAQTGPSAWRGTATVLQSDYGIKPYRALFGTLKLADAVGIEVIVELPGT